ncbi:MAG: ABC transporter permease [Spirochaetota bacterium]
MKGYAHHLAMDLKAGVRDATLMLMNYLFPIGFFVMIGLFMPTVNPGFVDLMIPGMIVFAIMSGTLMTIPATLVDQRSSGILRSFRVNGVPATSMITIPIIGSVAHMSVVAAILTIGSTALYGAPLPVNWGWFVLTFLLATLSFASLSALIGVVAKSSQSATLLAQLVYLPSVLLGGLMVPEELLPVAVARGASLLPATQAMRAFNALAFDGAAASGAAATPLVFLAVSVVLNLALCLMLFEWDNRTVRRAHAFGLLAFLPFALAVAFG